MESKATTYSKTTFFLVSNCKVHQKHLFGSQLEEVTTTTCKEQVQALGPVPRDEAGRGGGDHRLAICVAAVLSGQC